MAFGVESPLRFNFSAACKTGTSSDFRDNWAFGYTPEFTVGVWVGNFDGSPMKHISGVTGAAPLLHEVVEHLHKQYGTTWYSVPTNIVECWVHPVTGKRLWRFYAIPGPGEPGNETWRGDSWKTGGSPTWLTGSFERPLNWQTIGLEAPVEEWHDAPVLWNYFGPRAVLTHTRAGDGGR